MSKLVTKRLRLPDDPFFEEGSLVCRLRSQKYMFLSTQPMDSESSSEDSTEKFSCQVNGCSVVFCCLNDYEDHYSSRHRNACSGCGKMLPTCHLLELHLNEQHNPMFTILAAKVPMYRCLVIGCADIFTTACQRKDHLVKQHKYPASFRFERILANSTKGSRKGDAQKSQKHQNGNVCSAPSVQSKRHENEEQSMEFSALSTEPLETASSGENSCAQSRFKYTCKVPAAFSFGHGVQKGFYRVPRQRTKNHLSSTSNEHTEMNIETVNMQDLALALDTS